MSAADRFQDFVDGRMSDEEQEAFRERLAREPDLATRWDEHRERLSALREEEPLPPGFHTRTRAAFEHGRRRRRRRLLGVIPWEAVGLAAAAGLALALFVPGILREDLPLVPAASRQEATAAKGADERLEGFVKDSVAADRGNAAPPEAVGSSGNAAQNLEEQVAGSRAVITEPAETLPRDRKKVAAKPDATAPGEAARPAGQGDADDKARSLDRLEKQERFAPSPPPGSVPADAPTATGSAASSGYRQDAPQRSARSRKESPELKKSAPELESDVLADAAVVSALAVPPDAVAPRSVISIVDPAEFRAILDAGAKNWLREDRDHAELRQPPVSALTSEAEGPLPRPGQRAVVIGPRGRAFACEGLRVATDATRHVIYLAPAPSADPATRTACAVFLPADGREIVVVDP